ncbi:MAG: hypothetical protein R3C28_06245 [Pirellulaceae bacterium]
MVIRWRSEGGPYIGNGEYLLMNNVQRVWSDEAGGPVTPMSGEIPT